MSTKGLKETMAKIFEDPNRVNFRNLMKNITGEYNDLDFKREMIDCPKLAKHILAMANTEGGIICFGVEEIDEENLKPIGLETLDDTTKIQEKLDKYLPHELKYGIHIIIYENAVEWDELKNKKFLLIDIEFTPENIPFLPMKEKGNMYKTDIYCRKNSSSKKCEYDDLNEILNKRIQTNVSNSLSSRDLEDLYLLYTYQFYHPIIPVYKELYNLKLKFITKKIR